MRDGGGQVTLRIFKCLKPVIAAVNGPAVGIGVTMQLAMDIRIASDNARFGFVFSQRGIVPEAASSWFLPRIVGIAQALEWCYTGRVFPAQEALAGRLVSKVVPPDDLLPTARALAREIADNTAPVSVALIRQMMWRMLGADDPMEAHKIDSRGIYSRGALGGREGRRQCVPGKATGGVSGQGVGRHAGLFPVVAGARVQVRRAKLPRSRRQASAAGTTSREVRHPSSAPRARSPCDRSTAAWPARRPPTAGGATRWAGSCPRPPGQQRR